jgi:branched-chain amino acid aminotransferase
MNKAQPIWLNGRLVSPEEPCILPFDRGFTLGDGVFETIRAHGVRCLWLDDHLARFRQGAEVFGIPVPFSDDAIIGALVDLLTASNHEQSALRLTLSRGPSERRGLWPPSSPMVPTLVATVATLAVSSTPLRLLTAQNTRRNQQSPLSRIKSLNYGDNLLARREAVAAEMDDALMLNGIGRAACATVGNIFLRIGGRWRTPLVSEGALSGLARKRLLPMLSAEETTITAFDIAQASAGFISNCLAINHIQEIDGRNLEGPSAMLENLPLYRF